MIAPAISEKGSIIALPSAVVRSLNVRKIMPSAPCVTTVSIVPRSGADLVVEPDSRCGREGGDDVGDDDAEIESFVLPCPQLGQAPC